jgi:hypothetical protein
VSFEPECKSFVNRLNACIKISSLDTSKYYQAGFPPAQRFESLENQSRGFLRHFAILLQYSAEAKEYAFDSKRARI